MAFRFSKSLNSLSSRATKQDAKERRCKNLGRADAKSQIRMLWAMIGRLYFIHIIGVGYWLYIYNYIYIMQYIYILYILPFCTPNLRWFNKIPKWLVPGISWDAFGLSFTDWPLIHSPLGCPNRWWQQVPVVKPPRVWNLPTADAAEIPTSATL